MHKFLWNSLIITRFFIKMSKTSFFLLICIKLINFKMTTITRLFDFPYFQLEHYNIPDALVTKYNGVWIKTSTEEYIAKANAI